MTHRINLDDLEFALPPELIAQQPDERRDACRLLVVPGTAAALHEMVFHELPTLLRPGDLLVRNVTRVLPARLLGTKPQTGGRGEFLLLEPAQDGSWWALARPAKRLRRHAQLQLADGTLVTILEEGEAGRRRIGFPAGETAVQVAQRVGQMPLPPYIHRQAQTSDAANYQTVYAAVDGSVAAPTAGLHFTAQLLTELAEQGVQFADIVLHIGLGTFEPIRCDDPLQHQMHRESIEVPANLLQRLSDVRQAGGRIVAVGTTVARTLESLAAWQSEPPDRRVELREVAGVLSGSTSIFLHPPYEFRLVDVLITNFHLPHSTLLLLVGAFAGLEKVRRVYEHAIQQRFRFFSYGDATFWEAPSRRSATNSEMR